MLIHELEKKTDVTPPYCGHQLEDRFYNLSISTSNMVNEQTLDITTTNKRDALGPYGDISASGSTLVRHGNTGG